MKGAAAIVRVALLAALLAVLITGCRGGSERDVLADLLSNTPGPDVLPEGYWNTFSHDSSSAWPSDGAVAYSFDAMKMTAPRFGMVVASLPDAETARQAFDEPEPSKLVATQLNRADSPRETAQFEAEVHSVRCFEGEAPYAAPDITQWVQQCVVAVDRFLILSEVATETREEMLAPDKHGPFLLAAIRHVEAVAGLGE